jgi:CHAD domain-containing protein
MDGTFTLAALHAPLEVAVTALLADRMTRLRAAHAALAGSEVADALHDFRVAVRRVRVLARAYRPLVGDLLPRRVRCRLRELTRATNAARDLEVKRHWLAGQRTALDRRALPGLDWLDARLARAQQRARGGARDILDEVPRLVASLRPRPGLQPGLLSSCLSAGAFRALGPAGRDLAQRLDTIRTVADQVAAHRARIAAKRVRYLVEPFAAALPEAHSLVERLKEFQNVLGDMHDAHVAVEFIQRAMRAARRAQRRRPDPLPGLRLLERRAIARRAAAWHVVQRQWLMRRRRQLLVPLAQVERALAAAAAGLVRPGRTVRKDLRRGVPPRLRRHASRRIGRE